MVVCDGSSHWRNRLISINQPIEGIVIVVAALAPLITVNIIGFRSARMERIKKAEMLVNK